MGIIPTANLTKLFRRNRDGTAWYARVFRITSWRVFSQAVFFALFIFLLWVTWFSRLGGYPVSLWPPHYVREPLQPVA